MPGVLKLTEVIGVFGLVKVVVPGPLTLVHTDVSAPPEGRPSSLTVPFSVTEAVVELT